MDIGSKTHCYRRVLLCDTCRIPPPRLPARTDSTRPISHLAAPCLPVVNKPKCMAIKSETGKEERENMRSRKKRQKEGDVSFIYPHASVLLVKEGEDTRALSPNLLPASPCFSIDFSDKVRNHFSTLLHPLPSLSFLSFIRAHATSPPSSMFKKGGGGASAVVTAHIQGTKMSARQALKKKKVH